MSEALGFITAAAQYYLDSILIKPKRSIGAFTAQVTIEEVHHDELEITDHPVEQGAAISDHAFKRPAELILTLGWSNSPSIVGLLPGVISGLQGTSAPGLQSTLSGANTNQIRETYANLLQLQVGRIPFDVYTGKRAYTNMLLKGLSTTTNKDTENSLIVTAILRQVIIVQTRFVTVAAPVANQANPGATNPVVDAGTKRVVQSNRFNTSSAVVNPAP